MANTINSSANSLPRWHDVQPAIDNHANSPRSSNGTFHSAMSSVSDTSSSDNSRRSSIDSFWSMASSASSTDSIGSIESEPHRSANEIAIDAKLHTIFEKHINGDNREAFQTLIAQRSSALHAMDETPASIERVLSKGANLDLVAQFTRGAVRSIPFAIASVAFDKIPQLSSFANNAAEKGCHAGLQSGIVDTFGCKLLDKATANTTWLSATEAELDPLMQIVSQQNKPTDIQSSKENALAIQSYTVRNVERLTTAALTSLKKGAEFASEFDTWQTGILGIVAGGFWRLGTHAIDKAAGRVGADYFLGRSDWQEQYLALKNTNSYSDPLKGAGKRLAAFPLDIATDMLKAGREILTPAALAKDAVLAAGFSGTISARTAISTAMGSGGYSAASTAAISHLANIALSAPVFAAVPAAEILAPAAANKLSEAIQENVPNAVRWAADQIRDRLYASTPPNAAERNV